MTTSPYSLGVDTNLALNKPIDPKTNQPIDTSLNPQAAMPVGPAANAAARSVGTALTDAGAAAAPELGGAVGALAGALSKAGRSYRQQLHKDIDKLNRNEDLGYSAAQKRQKMAGAMLAANAATDAQMAELAAQSAAGGGGMSGAYADAAGALADAQQGGLADFLAGIEAQSQEQALSEAARIRKEEIDHRDKVARDWSGAATGLIKAGVGAAGGPTTAIDSVLGALA